MKNVLLLLLMVLGPVALVVLLPILAVLGFVAAVTGNVSGLFALMLCIGLLAAWCLATRQYIGGTLLLLLLGMMLLLFRICGDVQHI